MAALIAVMRVLAEMFGRWPLYFSHGPAAEIVSVVHFPVTLYSTRRPLRSDWGNGGNGSRRARRSEVGETITGVDGEGAADVGRKSGFPISKPDDGSSAPEGGLKRNASPSGVVRVSVRGLKVVVPA